MFLRSLRQFVQHRLAKDQPGPGRRGRRRKRAPSKASFRPQVIALEERCVPSGGFQEFALPSSSQFSPGFPGGITAGADGNLWFTELSGTIGRITPAGTVTEFPILTANSQPQGIAAGADGNLWFTELGSDKIGRITTAGAVTEFPVPTADSLPLGIAAGADGNLWFAESSNKIGRITTAGAVTEFPVSTANSYPFAITAGADGNLWFTDLLNNKIGRITPAGAITEFSVPTVSSDPWGITAGPDDNLWFTEFIVNQIGRITPAGAVTEFPAPTASSYPTEIAAGADGNLWFTDRRNNKIGRVTPAGAITEFLVPTASSYPSAIAAGPDGSIWFTELAVNQIGRLILPTYFSVTPSSNSIAAGSALSITVTALDPFNNVAANYGGTVHFSSSDSAATLPADYTFTAADNGVHTFSVTLRIAGSQSLVVTDTDNPALQGIAASINEFPVPTASSFPLRITAGPDGNLWFTELSGNKIGKMSPAGTIVEFPVLTASSGPEGITAGPDGNLWFTEFNGNKIGRITAAGSVTEFPLPTASSGPEGITAGPDGNLWFTEFNGNKIGRITTAGTVSEFLLPTAFSGLSGIAAGPDGNLWFTEGLSSKIGRITPAGAVTEFATPSVAWSGITAGGDGNVWFSEGSSNKIGRTTIAGLVTEFRIPSVLSHPTAIAPGPDGNLWFTETAGNKIGCITPGGAFAGEFRIPTASSQPLGIATGRDGNLWFTESSGNKIGQLIPGITVKPGPAKKLALSPSAFQVTAGVRFNVTVFVVDQFGNAATGYTGKVHFLSSDPQSTLPADYTFSAADRGRHTLPVTLRTAGGQLVKVADAADPSLTATAAVNVNPARATRFQVSAPAAATAGSPISIVVTARDPFGNIDSNYLGTAAFSTSDPDQRVVLPAAYTFTAAGAGVHTFAGGVTLFTPGGQMVKATGIASGITGSATVTVVKPGGSAAGGGWPVPAEENAPVSSIAVAPLPFRDAEARARQRPWASAPENKWLALDSSHVDRLFARSREDEDLCASSRRLVCASEPIAWLW